MLFHVQPTWQWRARGAKKRPTPRSRGPRRRRCRGRCGSSCHARRRVRHRAETRRHRQPLPLLLRRPPDPRQRSPGRARRPIRGRHRRRVPRPLGARLLAGGEAAGSPLPVVVYTHGGGFALLSPASTSLDGMCRRELGAVVVLVNYRLAPEHRCPAAYEDGVDVLRYLRTTGLPDGVSVDLSRCFLVGDSAGGNIAHHVAQRWISSPPPSYPVRLAGIILLQPYFGGEERTEAEQRLEGVAPVVNMQRSDWSWRALLPEGASRDHPAAHVTDENAELPEGFPPAMVVVGGFDPLQDWQWPVSW